MQQFNELPDDIEMLALKGFYASVNGTFRQVQKGEVVTLKKAVASEVRQTQKAIMATEDNLKKHADLVEAFKESKKPKDVKEAKPAK